jgi:peptide/nickel transport system substrate-binding protein
VLNALSAGVGSVLDRETVLAHERDGDLGHGWLRRHSAGSGPFQLAVWNPSEHLILERSPVWPGDTPALARVIFLDVREPATQRLMLRRGDVDMARNLGPDQVRALAGAEDIAVWSAPSARLFYLALNQRNEFLAKSAVRRAVRWLIDYDAITKGLLAGGAETRQTFLPRGMFGAIDDTPYYRDPLSARALLAEAGLEDGFAITMETRAAPRMMQIAQAIQAGMAEGGIRVEIVPGDAAQTLTRYRARRHAIYVGEWGPDYLDPHSNAAAFAYNPDNGDDAPEKTLAWRNGWQDAEVNAMTLSAVTMSDPRARAAAYAELQRRLQKDSPFVILFQDRTLFAARDNVRGLVAGPMPDQLTYRTVSKGPAS